MRLIGFNRRRTPASRRFKRRGSYFSRAWTVSLAIHLAILVLLLVTLKRGGREEMLPPPSPVTMVFESGRKEGPTLPEPSLQARPSEQAPPVQEQQPLPLPPTPPPPPPPPPPAPAAPPVPTPVPPSVEAPPPPPPLAKAPIERPPPAPKPPPKRPPPPKPSDFPAPMDFSLGRPFGAPQPRTRTSAAPRPPGTMDMSLGPANKGAPNISPFADIDTDAGGPDWRNALSRWVSQHAYYPEQARANFEDGDVKVHVVAQHNGRVTDVELISKSGSMWLDLALQSMFRDAHIPALPTPGNEPIEFNFTMHYILRRMP
jgi:protein TonB